MQIPVNTQRPQWLKKRIGFNDGRSTNRLLASLGINTICKEARCPNISECFKNRHATFLILGKYCSRNCRFCNVKNFTPSPPDEDEPYKVSRAVKEMELKHVVITSVTRDDLADGGASIFVRTVSEIKKTDNSITVELLIPDFKGNKNIIKSITSCKPEIIGHNLETVRSLYALRPEADYQRSLEVLRFIKESNKEIYTKSALMLGLGEKMDEVLKTMGDLRSVNCDFLALGQYLSPSRRHARVEEYIRPHEFQRYRTEALKLGFRHVESGPYVRSSYHAAEYLA